MTDVDHELGAIRFVVDAPLSSKVAMFNNVANQHKQSQYLNPFSNTDNRASPRRAFGKDEYGKPVAGSLTEMRGARANIHVCKEMLQLCQIIESEGFPLSKDEPNLKVILFGDLFNIYTLISDKLVGLLLRARKYKLIDFEGEVLFQRRDDDVPIYMVKSLDEIKRILEEKQDEVRRSVSPAPQPTTALLDNQRRSVSPGPRGDLSRSVSPVPHQQNASREPTPAPSQKCISRSVSPDRGHNNISQANEKLSDNSGRQQNNLSRSVSPAPQQSSGPIIKQEGQSNNINSDSQIESNTASAHQSNENGNAISNTSNAMLETNGIVCSQESCDTEVASNSNVEAPEITKTDLGAGQGNASSVISTPDLVASDTTTTKQ